MAITDVVVPQLSESVSEATLLTWKKQPGQAVQADEILIEVETDKVVLEVPAPASGVLSEIVKTDGSLVTSGEVLARIDTEGKAAAAPAAAALAPNAANPMTASLAACCAAKPTFSVPVSRFLNSFKADFIPLPSNSVMIGIASAISQVPFVQVSLLL